MLMIQEDDFDAFDKDAKFRAWIRELDEEVIQGEYGFERGEFDVIPALWHPLYCEGITPLDAYKHALADFAASRGHST